MMRVCLLLLAALACSALVLPRLSFPSGTAGRSVSIFSNPDVHNTTLLLLSDDEDALFVGARDAIISINFTRPDAITMREKLDWSPSERDLADCSMKGKMKMDCHNFVRVLQVLNSTHMYACGTFAFSPRCVFIRSQDFSMSSSPAGKQEEGRGRCPYDPYQKNTAITVDGELYTGTVADYRGIRPIISRHLSEGSHVDMKLDDTLGWLEDPTFISSAHVPSEGKVYFFFSEVGREYDFIDKFTVSRIAQVCTSDVGGQRTLQRRWTTFAKAQLLCQAQHQLPYNILQDIVRLPPPDGATEDQTLFYGVFTSQWRVNVGRSAVCAFTLRDIKAVFAGNYKVLNRDTLKWSARVQEKLANPGECGLHNASDSNLRFVKENFLSDRSVLPVGRGLTLVSPDEIYSNIAAMRVRGADAREYTLLFLLTESGYLQKAVVLEEGAHIVEEIQVFQHPQAVKSLLLSVSKAAVLIGSSEGVALVSMSNCSFYGTCAECVLARDPFCGWDARHRVCADVTHHHSALAQDVPRGNVLEQCQLATPRSRSGQTLPAVCPAGEVVWVSLGEVVRLACPQASRLSQRHWQRLNTRLSPHTYMQTRDGGLSFVATPATLGHFLCQSEENGYTRTLLAYQVRQRRSATPTPPAQKTLPTTRKDTPSLAGSTPGDWLRDPRRSAPPSYLLELVVVSVLLVLSLSALLTVALYRWRPACHWKTVPQSLGTQDTQSLGGHSPASEKRPALNAHAGNGKVGVGSGSNGHLPNTPT